MNGAEYSTASISTAGINRTTAVAQPWHVSILVIVALLGTLGVAQTLLVRSPLIQEILYLGYFIPIAIAAMRLSWRSAVETAILSAAVYLLATTPAFFTDTIAIDELVVVTAGHILLFLAAGVGLSTYRLKVDREKERALESEVKRVERLELLLDVSNTVSSSLKIEEVLQVLAVRIAEATSASFCRISLLDESKDNLRVVAAYPVREMDWEPSIGRQLSLDEVPDHRKAIETKEAVIVGGEGPANKGSLTDSQQKIMHDAASLLLYPLVVGEEAVGVVCIGEQRNWQRSPLNHEKTAICQTIVNQGAKAVAHALTHEALEDAFLGTIRSLAEAIDAKDPSTHGHSDWVSKYSVMIARQMDFEDDQIELLKFAGYLHDVGKIGIADGVLGKPSQLTAEQWKLMKKHPSLGSKILEPVKIAPEVKAAVRHHHERYDGKGYPYGLAGESIPLAARVLAVADAYEAMTADRPYRKALSDEQAVAELKRCSGTQFDPEVVDAFLGAMGRLSTRSDEIRLASEIS